MILQNGDHQKRSEITINYLDWMYSNSKSWPLTMHWRIPYCALETKILFALLWPQASLVHLESELPTFPGSLLFLSITFAMLIKYSSQVGMKWYDLIIALTYLESTSLAIALQYPEIVCIYLLLNPSFLLISSFHSTQASKLDVFWDSNAIASPSAWVSQCCSS